MKWEIYWSIFWSRNAVNRSTAEKSPSRNRRKINAQSQTISNFGQIFMNEQLNFPQWMQKKVDRTEGKKDKTNSSIKKIAYKGNRFKSEGIKRKPLRNFE